MTGTIRLMVGLAGVLMLLSLVTAAPGTKASAAMQIASMCLLLWAALAAPEVRRTDRRSNF